MLWDAMLVHLGAMFGQLGAILEQLGDKMRPKSAKMSQDSARWRTRAPRRGKIGELRRQELLNGGSNPCGELQLLPCTPAPP